MPRVAQTNMSQTTENFQTVSVTGSIANLQTDIILDSGSGTSIVSYDFACQLGIPAKNDHISTIRNIHGQSEQAIGKILDLMVDINNCRVTINFAVIKNAPANALLETDRYHAARATIDFNHGQLIMHGQFGQHTANIKYISTNRTADTITYFIRGEKD